MSLPSGFLDDLKARSSIAQVVGRKVTWDPRKSNPGKGDYWAPCPFHSEKTASFHVDDRQGFYYCFGCQAKGDALNFVRETENMGFMEAVELLAREAGMTVPAQDPAAAKAQQKRAGLSEIMELAVQFYRLQLRGGRAAAARDYLGGRGLDDGALERFEIGFASDQRDGLQTHLAKKGVPVADMDEAGLVIVPDDGGKPFDRFRGRIMFPIRDGRGRPIAFGGRAMSPEARAKYLNSPETPLFHKGSALYNLAPAREAAGKSGRLIVAEGYMDVIALARAGFDAAVAPLGTAITEDQLALMWRIADEPIIALDGDAAGLRAGRRLIDVAMPLLKAGKSLSFCILPEGQDPDDLLKAAGRGAMEALLAKSLPLFDMFWQRALDEQPIDSPERRAAFDARLKAGLALIKDGSVRAHYEAATRERRAELFRPARPAMQSRPDSRQRGPYQPGRAKPPARASDRTRASFLARANSDSHGEARIREATILAICLAHPDIAARHEAQIDAMVFLSPDLSRMRDALLGSLEQSDPASLRAAISELIGSAALESLDALGHVKANPFVRSKADKSLASQSVTEDIRRHRALVGRDDEVRDAQASYGDTSDEGMTWRLKQAAAAAERAGELATSGEGVEGEDRDFLLSQLNAILDE